MYLLATGVLVHTAAAALAKSGCGFHAFCLRVLWIVSSCWVRS